MIYLNAAEKIKGGIENILPYYKSANKTNKVMKGFPHIKAVGRRRGIGRAEPGSP